MLRDRGEVSPLARGVMWPVGATPIRPITGRHSLPPHSLTRTAISSPYGSLSLAGTGRAYRVPREEQDGLGLLCPPVALPAHDRGCDSPCARHSALLAGAWQHLRLLLRYDGCEDSHALTIPPDPSPAPPDAGRCAVPSRVQRQSCDCGSIVSGLSTSCYLPAVPPRVLMMGHQVPSEQWCSAAQFFTRLLVANRRRR